MVTDLALIVGIDDYEDSGALKGAVADAKSMISWISTHQPKVKIISLLSSQNEVTLPHFDIKLNEIRNECWGKGKKYRRLYLYFAGHGFSENYKKPCFLTQEAYVEHIRNDSECLPGYAFDDIMVYFMQTHFFSEIVILNDSCRILLEDFYRPAPFMYNKFSSRKKNVERPWVLNHMKKAFVGHACEFGEVAAEENIGGGRYRGVFTKNIETVLNKKGTFKHFSTVHLEKEVKRTSPPKTNPVFENHGERPLSLWIRRNQHIHKFTLFEREIYKGRVLYFKILLHRSYRIPDKKITLSSLSQTMMHAEIYVVSYMVNGKNYEGHISISEFDLRMDEQLSEFLVCEYDRS